LHLLAVRVAVLGFGWAGVLAAGFLLERFPGADVVAFEKSRRLGGLLSSAEINSFTFDVGGSHVIFSNDKAVLAEVVALLGGEALEHQRKAYVRLGDLFVPYPFENGLYVLPPEERAELIGDLVEALIKIPPSWRPKHLLDWIETTFGNGIARRYLTPYNEKIWKRPLDQISADWAYMPGRLPVPDVKTLIKTAAGIPTVGYAEQSRFYYPRRGGIQRQYQAALERVRDRVAVRAGEAVEEVGRRGGRLAVNGVEVDLAVAAMPLPDLVAAFRDAPEEVVKAAERLDYNQVVVVGVALDKPAPDQHWVYVPDRRIVFHRYAWLSNYSPSNAPPGRSALVAEITLPRGVEPDLERLKAEVVEGILELGVAQVRDVLHVEAWLHRYGYPVYTLDHAQNRDVVLRWLREQGVVAVGRWGQWHYWNTDKVYKNVKETIAAL